MFDTNINTSETHAVSIAAKALTRLPFDQDAGLSLIQAQDRFFASGATLSETFRRQQLLKLRAALIKFEAQLIQASASDLRKSPVEAYMAEIGVVHAELSESLKHLHRWMRPERRPTPMVLRPARSEIRREPLGRCLIMSPWNYPILLNLAPVIAAFAAGNVAILKPSELAPATSAVLATMIKETFPPELLSVIEGDLTSSRWLLEQRWDLICFTGGTAVGRLVAQAAARHLTPCILELGGKSPCIVSSHAQIACTARRIVWGKFLNAGQTCVAPDYILVVAAVHDKLVAALKQEIILRFGTDPLGDPSLPKIISSSHFERLLQLIEPATVAHGGRSDASAQLIEPTLLTGITPDSKIMQQEIFGPLLPILSVANLQEAQDFIKRQEKPLALYLFSENRIEQETILEELSFGGGCINDTLVHTGNPELPFGGVGSSGMGAYHGRHGFEAFSHRKGILHNNTWLDLPLRYRPWNRFKEKAFRLFLN